MHVLCVFLGDEWTESDCCIIKNQLDLTVIDLLPTFQEFGVTFTYCAVHRGRLISYSSPEGELRGRNGTGFKATLKFYILCHRLATKIGVENFLLENGTLLILGYYTSKNGKRFCHHALPTLISFSRSKLSLRHTDVAIEYLSVVLYK